MEKNSHIFSIVSRCNTEDDSKSVIECVESIKLHHPNSEIVVVDSNSPNRTHFEKLIDYGCFIEDIKNGNYETGAMWYIYFSKKYERDVYIFLQDSMTVMGNLSHYFQNDLSIIDYCMGWDHCKEDHINWAKEELKNTDYLFLENGFPIVQYNSLIVKRLVLDKLNLKHLSNIKPKQKYESETMERILGLCLHQEGYLNELNLIKISTELIKKTWKHRQ